MPSRRIAPLPAKATNLQRGTNMEFLGNADGMQMIRLDSANDDHDNDYDGRSKYTDVNESNVFCIELHTLYSSIFVFIRSFFQLMIVVPKFFWLFKLRKVDLKMIDLS